jgi:hypothetical protein
VEFQGFVGPTYTLKSTNVDSQRCVNLYPEIIESGDGKEARQMYYRSTPGLTFLKGVGTGPLRCVHTDPSGSLFVVSGFQIFTVYFDGVNWIATLLGALSSGSSVVKAKSTVYANRDAITVFVDQTIAYAAFFKYSTLTTTFGTLAALGYVDVNGPTHVELIDNFFIYNKFQSNQIFVSDFNSLNVSPLSFASAEANPDYVQGHISNHNQLWIFKDRSTEIWQDTGNADFPFERIQGGIIEIGCYARYSIAKINGFVFWLGRTELGKGAIYAASGLTPQKISTGAVESAINSYSGGAEITAYTYQTEGHSFYVLNFTQGTWVYDLSTKLWHERAYLNAGTLERHRANYHAFDPTTNYHFIGDYTTNSLYRLDDTNFTDNLNPIMRLRAAPFVSAGGNRVFCKALQIDMESGVGLDAGLQGSDPQVMMDYSDDGGHTFVSQIWTTIGGKIGGIGQYNTRVIWRRLGSFRSRVFRIKITDPVPITILGAWLDIEDGGN